MKVKNKICKHCSKSFEPKSSLHPTCSPKCYDKYKIAKEKEKKKLKQEAKNTVAKFFMRTKLKIIKRDLSCVCCAGPISEFHHIYYGIQAEHGKDRNDIDKGVGLCYHCHYNIHHGENSQELREFCITYINKLKSLGNT